MQDYLIVGLGNVGNQFVGTRHNVGIRALRLWVEKQGEQAGRTISWRNDASLPGEVAQVDLPDARVWTLFPFTMMNNSGQAVAQFLKTHTISLDRTLIVHDDLEISFGEVDFKLGGSAKGHNGVRSIHQVLQTQDFYRLRIGIGRPTTEIPVDAFVLQKFTAEEEIALQQQNLSLAEECIDTFLKS